MNNIRIGFVVLHYQAFDMTVECIETLKKTFPMNEMFVVIVDNNSPNGSGKQLVKKYNSEINIEVILSPENLGFAKGNNLGYKFLKNNFDCDFIIIMNNDVLIKQTDFFDSVENLYDKEKFAVLGPDIYCPKSGVHQNPFRLNGISKKEFNKMYFMEKVKGVMGYSLFMKLLNPILNFRHKKNCTVDNYKNEFINPVLHGACFIFSKDFISVRDYAFDPRTYMFFEENILHYECMNLGLKMFYSPKIQVTHMEDVSTDFVFKKNVQKENWKIKNTINSMKIYKSFLEGNNE